MMSADMVIPDKEDFKIGEVCDIAGVKPFVLRYWETEFTQLTPSKGAGGQRTYSRADVELIMRIKQLLYEERFTVAGAKKRLLEEEAAPPLAKPKAKHVKLDSAGKDKVEEARRVLGEVREQLAAIINTLK
jgi:DNA-binding transcriptional MerR regulator